MSLIKTNANHTVFKDAESMLVMPYVYNSTLKDYILGSDIYDLSAIIGDSIVIEQSEGNTTTKENEFVASPLLQNASGSKYGFTAQILDLQNAVLKSIFGALTVSGNEGVAAFSDDFVTLYALIRIRFADSTLPDVILPKVQMNSKLFIQQLHTRAGQGNIVGTALAYDVCVEKTTPSGALMQFSSPNTYVTRTPVLFIPRSNTPLFAHTIGDPTNFYEVNFATGAKTQLYVDATSGTWSATPA